MGIGPNPGLTFKVECTSNSGHVATLSGDVTISLGGSEEAVEYFKVGTAYVAHFRLSDGDSPDGGDSQEAAKSA